MSEYRFHLAGWRERDKSVRCPRCGAGKGAYKEYVDDYGKPVDPLNHLCGKCDSEKRCGYHVTPSEWQKQHGKIDGEWRKKEEVQKTRIEIDKRTVSATIRKDAYVINTLVVWLRSLPWNSAQRETLEHALQLYCVGTMKNGSVIFWQIDQDRVVRTGKKMMYSSNGKRLKDSEGHSIGFGFMHNIIPETKVLLDAGTHTYIQCAFGLHLTKVFPDAEVHVVESEKTALLMTCYDQMHWHEHVWVAVGSMYQLKPEWLPGLKGRIIVCYPDANAVEEWKARAEAMMREGWRITVSTTWMKCYDVEHDPKADIGDLVLKKLMETSEGKREFTIERYPVLEMFVKRLGLQIIEQ